MGMSIIDQLDEIFNIPKDGSNIKEEEDESQETSYAEVITAGAGEKFEDKAAKLYEKIAKDAPPHNVVYLDKEDSNDSSQQRSAEEKKIEQNQEKDKFEKILTDSVRSKQPIGMEVLPVVQKPTPNNKIAELDEDDADEDKERFTLNNENVPNNNAPNEQGWLLIAPSPMFKHFYAQKASFITSITKTGTQLPIDDLLLELKKSYVSTQVEMTDLQGMYDRLTDIQNFLDRVVQIKILATSQCSAMKRAVELLRGVLAKVCYEKPAARQDGVNYDHLRDFEMYSCQVESLEHAAKDVYHNLLEAKEILSRKISVAIELFKQQSITDNIEKTANNLPINVKKAIQSAEKSTITKDHGFDKLEVHETVKNNVAASKTPIKKSGQIDWLD